MLKTIATHLARKFKRFPYFGRQRFWILYWAYKITGWHIRHEEWDFILKYLPKLHNMIQHHNILVMDVGCAKSLFGYEVVGRRYKYFGVDISDEEIYIPEDGFTKADITDCGKAREYDFVTCISVLEHIGNDGKGDYQAQKKAVDNMLNSLKIGGRLLMTIPTKEFAQGHPWHGFCCADIAHILFKNKGMIIHSEERAGQICMAIERI